jgi:hypothetical protein
MTAVAQSFAGLRKSSEAKREAEEACFAVSPKNSLRPDSWETSFFKIGGEIARFTDKLAVRSCGARSQKKGRKTGGARNRVAAARAARCEEARAAHKSLGGGETARDPSRALQRRRIDRFLPGDAELIALEVAADGGQDGGAASLTGPLILTSSESVPRNN